MTVRRALLAVGVLLVLAGCERHARLVPATADSTSAAPDSFAVAARLATDRWESGAEDEAADWSAHVVQRALAVRLDASWPDRARGVLDSLGIGAETVGDGHVAVLNLFSRATPNGTSWPYLLWRQGDGVRTQAIAPRGLHLESIATRGLAAGGAMRDSAMAAVLWSRRVGAGSQPLVSLWRQVGGAWTSVQELGPDSLGGLGTATVESSDTAATLVARTSRAARYFEECPTCPHVVTEHRFAWGEDGFTRREDRAVASPYATFTAFIAALVDGDRARQLECVAQPGLIETARHADWHNPGKGRWRIAPGSDAEATTLVFDRGQREAWRVSFESHDGAWRITGLQATTRTIE